MKNNKIKYLFTIIWVCCSTQIFCQSYTEAQRYFDEGRIVDAKQQIDEYLTQNTKDINALVLKSKIYYTLVSSKQYSDVVADGKSISIAALKQANSINAQNVSTILQTESYGLPINLYNDLTNEAIATFNSATERRDKNLYEQSLTQFKKAIAFSQYIYEQNWGLATLDSNNLLNATKAAIYAAKEDDALLFAKKIADNNIVKTIDNKAFQAIYEWLVFYYKQHNNENLLTRYTDLGMMLFPKSGYFLLNKIDWLRSSKQYNQIEPNYKLLFSKGFSTSNYYNSYFNEIFNLVYTIKDSIINKYYFTNLFEKEIKDYTAKNKTDYKTMLLAGKFYYNQFIDNAKNKASTNIISLTKKTGRNYLIKVTSSKLAQKDKAVYNEALILLKKL